MRREAVFCVLMAGVAMLSGCGSAHKIVSLPSTQCGPVVYRGSGHPDALIVSDLPLANPPSARMQIAGIESVLAQRGFRAGKLGIGYQSCDDSTQRANGFDPARCAANAKAYAATRDVIGIIGPFNSPCASQEIAAANQAPDGPLVMIGTATTYVGLTVAAPGTEVGEPEKYYPTGKRSFVRLTAPDQFQAAAAVLLAQQHHLQRVVVLDDGEPYGSEIAAWFRRAAAKRGLTVVGSAAWNPKARRYDGLVANVVSKHPDGVYLSGYSFLHGGILLKALKSRLPGALFMAPDGFSDETDLRGTAGSAAENLYVSVAGVNGRAYGQQAQKLLRQTGPEGLFSYGAPYGAVAASILLDAIARSDGSRDGVRTAVLQASAPAGYLGPPFSFDKDGDPTIGAMTMVKFSRGHFEFAETLYPSAALAKGPSPG